MESSEMCCLLLPSPELEECAQICSQQLANSPQYNRSKFLGILSKTSAGTLDSAVDRRFRPHPFTHGVRHPTQPPTGFTRATVRRLLKASAIPAPMAPAVSAPARTESPIAAAAAALGFLTPGRRRRPLGPVGRPPMRPVPVGWTPGPVALTVPGPRLLPATPGMLLPPTLEVPPIGKFGEPAPNTPPWVPDRGGLPRVPPPPEGGRPPSKDGVGNDPPAAPVPDVTPGPNSPLLLPPGPNAVVGLPRP